MEHDWDLVLINNKAYIPYFFVKTDMKLNVPWERGIYVGDVLYVFDKSLMKEIEPHVVWKQKVKINPIARLRVRGKTFKSRTEALNFVRRFTRRRHRDEVRG